MILLRAEGCPFCEFASLTCPLHNPLDTMGDFGVSDDGVKPVFTAFARSALISSALGELTVKQPFRNPWVVHPEDMCSSPQALIRITAQSGFKIGEANFQTWQKISNRLNALVFLRKSYCSHCLVLVTNWFHEDMLCKSDYLSMYQYLRLNSSLKLL